MYDLRRVSGGGNGRVSDGMSVREAGRRDAVEAETEVYVALNRLLAVRAHPHPSPEPAPVERACADLVVAWRACREPERERITAFIGGLVDGPPVAA